MPKVSVIMPVYNVEKFISEAITSVLAQTFNDFELLIIDDVSPDNSVGICKSFNDARIQIIHHAYNRGLAGARNTGIQHASGDYLAFLDSDDCWHNEKLARHVEHLDANQEIGISFSRSAFINEQSIANNCYQMPRLKDIEHGYYLCRNPIGNGSAPVIRKQVFEDIGYHDNLHNIEEYCYFDPRLRQSEDIECWIRIALTTNWVIEGIPEALTFYRLNAGGLSANLQKQLESWEQVIDKTRGYAPLFIAFWEHKARAFQLRYLARQAIRLHDGRLASQLMHRALASDASIIFQEPARTLVTLAASYLLRISPQPLYQRMENLAQRLIGMMQYLRIRISQVQTR